MKKEMNQFNKHIKVFHSAYLLYLTSIFILLTSCSSDKTSITKLLDNRDSSTIQMALELENLSNSKTVQMSLYASKARSKYFKEQAAQSTGTQQLTFDLRSEFEKLTAGESRDALAGFYRIDSISRSWGIPEDQAIYRLTSEFRAIANLRIGEQENCLLNHSAGSCIIPLDNPSIHKYKEGSTKAIEELKILLSQKDDLNLRWVLNIAYMTLGKYPSEVPAEYLLPIMPTEESHLTKGRFTNISSMLGIDDNRLSGGVVIEDFDNDMDLDIMVSSWGLKDQVYYYENDGLGEFTNKYKEAGIEGITGGLNMTHGDYNNDGFFDVFITRGAWIPEGTFPNSLLRNNGDGSFTDVTKETKIYSLHPTQTSAWADFNNDGFVDIFIGNESYPSADNHPCELWLNNGNETFTNVANSTNSAIVAFIKGVSTSDYDNDGDVDIYLSNMAGDNFLLRNDPTDAAPGFRFTNIASQLSVNQPKQSFPCWFFDVNNDGWDDIFISGFPFAAYGQFGAELAKEMMGIENNVEKPKLFTSDRKGGFSDATEEYGLNTSCYTMGSSYGDINNDGYPDFYLGTGEPDLKALVPNRMFLNLEGQKFGEVTSQGGFGHIQKGHAISFADLDNDGDEDVYAVMGGAYEGDIFYNALFENPGTDNNWIKVKLEGTKSNKAAYGAKVILNISGPKGHRQVYKTISSGSSFGENPSWCHLGFLENESIESLSVKWPSGLEQNFSLQERNFYKLIEENNEPEKLNLSPITFKKENTHHH